jgi:ferric-dicitrate binding protein FerR (iron transport regulator)
LEQLNARINTAPVVSLRKNRFKWWIPAAAAVLLLLAGLGYWAAYNPKTKLESQYGAIREYQLPDGSKVTLNAHSEITMHKAWKEGNDREVWLKGEAFFKVQKTPAHNRFIVHTNSMDIIVTGTQFNVISREEESSILLTEGSVTVRTPDGKEVHMKPGDFVRMENNAPSLQLAEQERVLAWKQAKLDFENTSMSEVARIIARHYGVKVSLGDKSLADKKITAVMPNDNLDVLIQALEATGEYKVTRTSGEIVISGTE